jgi:uncharacterized protein (TIGR03000 family)
MFRSWFSIAGVIALGVLFVAADSSNAQLLRRRARTNNTNSRRSFYPPDSGTQGTTGSQVSLDVRVPVSDAQIMIEGQKTNQMGTLRRFVSPPLTPGVSYTYEIKATWTQDGKKVTRSKKVDVQAGQQLTVDLTKETGGSKESKESD